MRTTHFSDRQGGMALLEAMIAVVVLAFGLLGVAGLQLAGIKSNQIAYERSVATMHAYGVADRIRAGMNSTQYKAPSLSEAQAAASSWVGENALLPGESVVISQVDNRFRITVSWTDRCKAGDTNCSSGTATGFVTEFLP